MKTPYVYLSEKYCMLVYNILLYTTLEYININNVVIHLITLTYSKKLS